MSKVKKETSIEDIVSRYGNVNSSIVEKALEMKKQEEEERQAKVILSRLNIIDSIQSEKVDRLREIRKQEQTLKKEILEFEKLKNNFYKNPSDENWDKIARK